MVSYPCWGGLLGSVEGCLVLRWGLVAAVPVEAVFVEPVDPRHGEHLVRKQPASVLGQEREHAPRASTSAPRATSHRAHRADASTVPASTDRPGPAERDRDDTKVVQKSPRCSDQGRCRRPVKNVLGQDTLRRRCRAEHESAPRPHAPARLHRRRCRPARGGLVAAHRAPVAIRRGRCRAAGSLVGR